MKDILKAFLSNPKTTSIGLGAAFCGLSCYMGWLSHESGEIAIFAVLSALGIVTKDA